MWNDFKNFAFKGNAFDLAVGVIMGGAFGAIVTSVVNDILMPVISLITGGVSFTNRFAVLAGKTDAGAYADAAKQATVLGYGSLIDAIIHFLAIAAFLFMLVRISNSMKKAEPAPPPAGPTPTEALLAEIRDSLKSGKK
ncbi:MAG: large conductance mechanosensitive channel protein MscL [Alphaproteobacteria bacterium]|nr:large conductance mechanosensitive channel protein MscL [Alphaproteobacteria bacterium]